MKGHKISCARIIIHCIDNNISLSDCINFLSNHVPWTWNRLWDDRITHTWNFVRDNYDIAIKNFKKMK